MRRGIGVAEGWGGGDEPMSEGGMGAKEVTHRATRWRTDDVGVTVGTEANS